MIQKSISSEANIYGATNFLINLRNLWLDLAIWTRNYMVSILSDYGNADAVGARLYRIPIDFYNRLQVIFGAQRTQGLVTLLSQHVALMMEATLNMKTRDNDALNKNTQLLYQNANDLANYLVGLNPYWTVIQWNTLLDQFINMTLQELVALASRDFVRDIDIFDRITYYTVFLADYMTEGIVQYITFAQEPPEPISPTIPLTPIPTEFTT